MEQLEKVCKALGQGFGNGVGNAISFQYPGMEKEYNVTTLLGDALTLIRQQRERIAELEAERTERVMTLEEVKCSEVVYLEDFTEPDDGVEPIIRPAVNIEAKNGGIVMLDSVAWDEGFIFVVDSEYGKTWRCWTQRPTDEQRKATPWND